MSSEVWRYAFLVGSPNGPRSLIWRISCDKSSNIFLFVRPHKSELRFKTTFHPPSAKFPAGKRHEGYVETFFRQHHPEAPTHFRHMREWEGDQPLGGGYFHAYRLLFPRSQLMPASAPNSPARTIQCFDPPPMGETLVIDLVLYESSIAELSPSMEGARSSKVCRWLVPDGRYLQLVIHHIPDKLFKFGDGELDTLKYMLMENMKGDPLLSTNRRVTLWFGGPGEGFGCADLSVEGLLKATIVRPS